jgi:hypothetical protein
MRSVSRPAAKPRAGSIFPLSSTRSSTIRDLVALLRHNALEFGQLAKQPDHQSFELSAGNVRKIIGRRHPMSESYRAASRKAKNAACPGFCPDYDESS